MKRDGFTHAATSQNTERLAGVDRKAYVLKDLMIAKCLVDMLEFDVRLFVLRRWLVNKIVHVSRSEKRRCARARSSGVFRFSNISAAKANFRNSDSLITRVLPLGNNGTIL